MKKFDIMSNPALIFIVAIICLAVSGLITFILNKFDLVKFPDGVVGFWISMAGIMLFTIMGLYFFIDMIRMDNNTRKHNRPR